MVRDISGSDNNFFAAEREKEAGRIINEANARADEAIRQSQGYLKTARNTLERVTELQDTISVLNQRVSDRELDIENWKEMYNREHGMRTRKRTWLDWLIGYVG